MSGTVVVGNHLLKLRHVCGAKFEGPKLFVHFVGGRFETFSGEEAQDLWAILEQDDDAPQKSASGGGKGRG